MNENYLSNEEILDIQKKVDIVDIISEYVPLNTKGKNFFGVCPFHPDHSPSMSVSREKQFFKCFSCRASGNVFKFIMDYENVNFIEAVKIVASKAGITLNIGSTKKPVSDKTNILYDIYDLSLKFYKNNINTKDGKKAREFIEKRKFDQSIIKDFDLGLSLKGYDSLTNLLVQKKYKQNDMIRTGLVIKSDKGYRDMYSNRIMFPIHDLTGKVVGYSGRFFAGEDSVKYFNTKETEIFKKGELLYNYHRAKNEARDKGYVIVVEGFFALIRLHTIGVKNVVATLGTAVTKNQAMLLKRMAKDVYLCFDGDSAGDEATNSCINELSNIGVSPKIIRLEDNLDPDDYVLKYGKDRMIDKINNPLNVIDYKLRYYKGKKNLSNSEELSEYINIMIGELKKIDDVIYKEITLKKLSDESGVSIDILRNKLDDNVSKEKIKKEPLSIKPKKNKYVISEERLIYYMLDNKEVIKLYMERRPMFFKKEYRELSRVLEDYYKNGKEIKSSNLLTEFNNDEYMYNIISSIISNDIKDEFKIEEINDYIKIIKEKNYNDRIKKLNEEIKKTTNKDEQVKISMEILNLKKQMIGE